MRNFATVLMILVSIFTSAHSSAQTDELSFEAADAQDTQDTETRVEPPPVDLPKTITQILNLEAGNGTCEQSWMEYAKHIGVTPQKLSEGTTLYLVPCAMWAHNLAWMAFVTIDEPKHPDGHLTLPMRFVDYSAYEGLVARSIIHNINWDAKTQKLRARFFLNGKEHCGSAAEYVWDSGQRNLRLKTLLKQDICDGQPGPWMPVFQSSEM